MNIDVVNKIISNNTGTPEEVVAFINDYYWKMIKEHITSYNPYPVNINSIGVIYANKYHLRSEINRAISQLRSIKSSKKYKQDSEKYKVYVEILQKALRGFLKIRKEHKYTN